MSRATQVLINMRLAIGWKKLEGNPEKKGRKPSIDRRE